VPISVALDIVLKNKKKKNLKKRAQLQHLKTGHLAAGGCERFVIVLTQVPDTLTRHTKTCKSSVSTYNQFNLESTQNQPRPKTSRLNDVCETRVM
jgi:hypothetical protein